MTNLRTKPPLFFPPPAQAATTAFLIWQTDQQLPELTLSFPGQGTIGVLATLAAAVFALSGMVSFFRNSTTIHPHNPHKTSHLVTHGVYRVSRNPMYLGLALLLLALTVALGAPLGLLLIGLFIWSMNELQIKPEERVLGEKFGAGYRAYRKKVRRWL